MRKSAPAAWLGGGAVAAVGLAGLVVAAPMGAAGAATPRPATVNVVHGIPGVSVKVCVDGAGVVDHFRFGHKIVGAQLPAGPHKVRVVAAGQRCSSTAILKAVYSLQAGRNYTVVANLNAAGTPNLKAFRNSVAPTKAGTARVSVRHTAQAPAVNVWAGQAKLIGGKHFTWGHRRWFAVPAGTYQLTVTLPGSTTPVIGPASAKFRAGRAYQVYAVGSAGHYRLVTVRIAVGTR